MNPSRDGEETARRTTPPAVLVVAGLDPTGGAGLSLDLAVLRSQGIRGLPVASCLTVQTFREFREARPVEDDLLERMVRAALESGPPRAVKTGLLAAPAQAGFLARFLPGGIPLVVDPVLRASLAPGEEERETDLAEAVRERLLALGAVVTPNLPELFTLAGTSDREDPSAAAEILLRAGAAAVVLKGGHGTHEGLVADMLYLPGGKVVEFTRERDSMGEVHGTGCAFSTALAGFLAAGKELEEAARAAGDLTARLRLASLDVGGKARLLFP